MKTPTLTAVLCLVLAGLASAQSVSSTVNEDNGATNSAGDGNQIIYSTPNHPAIVTQASGYDFSSGANNFMNLGGTISSLTFTATIIDGDSGSAAQEGGTADFDYGHLFLYLAAPSAYNSTTGILTGGVNTGVMLNGFRGFALVDTLTFTSSVSSATSSAILAQLATGMGHLDAFVVSDNSADMPPTGGNEVFVGNDGTPSNALTTLSFNAVPEPSTYALLGLGLLGALAPQVRRFRRNS